MSPTETSFGRRRACIALLCACVGMWGCGGSNAKQRAAPRPTDERAAIAKTIQTYLYSLAGPQIPTACAQLTREVVRRALKAYSRLHPRSCSELLTDATSLETGNDSKRLSFATVSQIVIADPTALVQISFGLDGITIITKLQKLGGHWYIAGGFVPGPVFIRRHTKRGPVWVNAPLIPYSLRPRAGSLS